jgi:hypothetical protein
VFSPNSIGRTWLHRELDALTQLETIDRKVILPLLHDLTPAQLQEASILLSGRLALSTTEYPVEQNHQLSVRSTSLISMTSVATVHRLR